MGEVLVGYVMRQYMADAQPMHVMIPIAGWTEIYSFCEVSCNLVFFAKICHGTIS